ncbi:hypothetical protein [Kitasatospora sp. LaBMicrA B282]|uniref:hypothetical protein n=1 Tax=Kitasatospora sp. LaBMicrA B282 TaxID=3420949 RepID=UPI003D1332B6
MTLTVGWTGMGDETGWVACVPVRVSAAGFDVVVAPGEPVRCPPGPVRLSADVPGCALLRYQAELPAGDGQRLQLLDVRDLDGAHHRAAAALEPTGRLLLEYLVAGKYAEAAAAARAVEVYRGQADPRSWTAPSCTQLLIGYAHGLGRDVARLAAWCRRTAAAEVLGPDGRVLAAVAATTAEPADLHSSWLRLLGGADGRRPRATAGTRARGPITVTQGKAAMTVPTHDPAGPAGAAAPPGTPAAARSQALSRYAVVTAVIAVGIWLGFSVYLLVRAGDGVTSDLQWTRMAWVFGSVQALAFTAAGALFGTSVQTGRVAQAESRAEAAAADANRHREEAAKGRAMATVLQADEAAVEAAPGWQPTGPGGQAGAGDVRRRYAHLSRTLFGNLVQPPGDS